LLAPFGVAVAALCHFSFLGRVVNTNPISNHSNTNASHGVEAGSPIATPSLLEISVHPRNGNHVGHFNAHRQVRSR
jgi:hypothetical protein